MARPRPEDFLELVERAKRGRLKVYIGFAAGVGKTYHMLEEAHALQKRGVDVVVGFVETHGRAETAAMIEGLEVVPRKKIEHRGLLVEEMDLEGVLARHPRVALVDEIAHTNVPGSRNAKRYQDVQEILNAGINVVCAFNVQHLESLKDLVQRVTGVVIRETVPDTFLRQADQVVNLDLAVEDLTDRLQSGKIYEKDKIPWALDHFFKEENLLRLRELALREVAESVDRSSLHAEGRRRSGPPRGRGRAGDGLHRLVVAAGGDAPAARVAAGRPLEHLVVRGLRGDARRGPPSDRRRGPAAALGQHRKGAGAGRRGGPLAVPRSGGGPGRFRPLPRRRLRHDRPHAPALVAADSSAARP